MDGHGAQAFNLKYFEVFLTLLAEVKKESEDEKCI